jgi:hypothetical protein
LAVGFSAARLLAGHSSGELQQRLFRWEMPQTVGSLSPLAAGHKGSAWRVLLRMRGQLLEKWVWELGTSRAGLAARQDSQASP